jgi:hypothetical protein
VPDGWDGEGLAFLVGPPCSGAALVARHLRTHPAIAYWEDANLLHLACHLVRDVGHLAGRLGDPDPTAYGVKEARRVVGRLHADFLATRRGSLVLEGTDSEVDRLPELRRVFPGSRAIVVACDPRDAAESSLRLRSRGEAPAWLHEAPDPVEALARAWRRGIRRALAAIAADGGDRVRLVRFEDFATEPDASATDLCGFLGLPGERAGATAALPAVGRWRDTLGPAQAATVVDIAGPEMDRLGYDLS